MVSLDYASLQGNVRGPYCLAYYRGEETLLTILFRQYGDDDMVCVIKLQKINVLHMKLYQKVLILD